jgi:OmcA/MtrC family decaheme c-type cytochrome
MALTAAFLAMPRSSAAQTLPVSWEDADKFQFNIESILLNKSSVPWRVQVIFTISNPTYPNAAADPLGALWDIKTAAPFKSQSNPAPLPTASPRLSVDVGWDTSDYTNNSIPANSDPMLWLKSPPGSGIAPALPVAANGLTQALVCDTIKCPGVPDAMISRTYYVTSSISPVPFFPAPDPVRWGAATMWGHPVLQVGVDQAGRPVWGNVPVKSVFKTFTFNNADPAVARRQVVDINKCKGCHDDNVHGTTLIPRLTLHGTNRTEEPGVCVVCHNPNQTDIAYRTSGAEEAVDFKRMVHGIHAGGMRRNPLVIVGRGGTLVDFSGVRFPAELSNCLLCHVERNGRGTFELPLAPTVLGSTIDTRSRFNTPGLTDGYIDINPWNDLKITPTAAVCSACHDDPETRQHMVSRGASFGITQLDIWAGAVVEQCATCHGPGREKDVRRVHEIGGSVTGSASLTIGSAVYKVEESTLRVSGERAPRNAQISVANAATGVLIGTVIASSEGQWQLTVRISRSQAPGKVIARSGNLVATREVKFD